jgi:hypothetical protein
MAADCPMPKLSSSNAMEIIEIGMPDIRSAKPFIGESRYQDSESTPITLNTKSSKKFTFVNWSTTMMHFTITEELALGCPDFKLATSSGSLR